MMTRRPLSSVVSVNVTFGILDCANAIAPAASTNVANDFKQNLLMGSDSILNVAGRRFLVFGRDESRPGRHECPRHGSQAGCRDRVAMPSISSGVSQS